MKQILGLILVLTVAAAAGAEPQRLTVTAGVANIRSGPGTTHDVLWQVQKYFPIAVIEKSGAWYRFRDFEDDVGWIHRSLVGDVPALITKTDRCNIRSGPGLKHKVLFSVGLGIPFKILDSQGNWFHVEHADGDSGWIHNSLIWK